MVHIVTDLYLNKVTFKSRLNDGGIDEVIV
jgi:hypothetical protein